MLDRKRPRIDSDEDTIHRFGPNSFKLQSLPVPKPGQILGLVGNNGIGKSATLKLLSGKAKPNFGRFNNPPDWKEILAYCGDSELRKYFIRILLDNLEAICKPQYVDHLSKFVRGNVMDRNVEDLSGGELQRFAIASAALQNADIYLFDEPSSYLDVKQRLKAAQIIRSLVRPNNYVIVVEHDLSVLDYLSDFICCLYGKPGKYGAVTLPFSVREGINIFLAGYVPTENLWFRHKPLRVAETPQESTKEIETCARYKYPTMTMTCGNFRLRVVEGEFTDSQIIVMLGENGTGKSTFLQMLAGFFKPDSVEGSDMESLNFSVSYKPQRIGIKLAFECSVKILLHAKIPDSIKDDEFLSNVYEPLSIQRLMDKELGDLSAGEMQMVAITLCLGKPADVYLLDEPSTYLDSEHCIVASNVIKKFIHDRKKTALVVDHDFMMSTYLADRVIVYEGKPSIDCVANSPQSVLTGMNLFLSHLDITLRRDRTNLLPRINKHESIEDLEQMAAGSYYYMDN
ncbi:ABC transporter E family member 2-like isoform X2 [Salvia hispanica]|uniref:ABC transporter E family member 2-like isoform X2 n=1 Tax=Salvia hispanica TaxID=49212 RepID=UPI00200950A9|nr:ABC transporter E family member 2-like isoform X2 [Salvia hispanica]